MKYLKAEDDEKYGELYRQKNGHYFIICFHCGEYFQLIETIINHIETVHFHCNKSIPSELDEIKTEEIFVDVLPKCDDYYDNNDKNYKDSTIIASHINNPSHRINSKKLPSTSKSLAQLTCEYCQHLFDKKSLEKHMFKKHFPTYQQSFVCNICEQKFNTKTILNSHKKIDHNINKKDNDNFKCDLCIQSFLTKRSYISHIRKKHTKYKCEECHCQYNQKRNLLVHYRQKHLPENERPSYTCTHCGRSCMTNALLQDHIRIHHTNEKPYMCKICDARFPTRTYLCQHRSRIHGIGNSVSKTKPTQHNGNEKFQCSTCGQISNYRKCYKKTCYTPGVKSSTNRPLQKRNVTKSHHTCTACGKLYLRRDKFEQHIIDCMKKLECQYCHKLFKNRKSYNSHIIDNHNDTKIRPCRYCDMVFKKHWQRYAHEKKHKIELGLIDDDDVETTNLNNVTASAKNK